MSAIWIVRVFFVGIHLCSVHCVGSDLVTNHNTQLMTFEPCSHLLCQRDTLAWSPNLSIHNMLVFIWWEPFTSALSCIPVALFTSWHYSCLHTGNMHDNIMPAVIATICICISVDINISKWVHVYKYQTFLLLHLPGPHLNWFAKVANRSQLTLPLLSQ